jgi:hypothetical protein
MNLENYTKMRALEQVANTFNSKVTDHFLNGNDGDEIREKLSLKRLQFDTTPERFSDVEGVCQLLDCSKREFLEMAVRDAIDKVFLVFGATFKEASGHEWDEGTSHLDAMINGAPVAKEEA